MAGHVRTLPQVGAAHPDVRRAIAARGGRDPHLLLVDGIWAHRAALHAGVDVKAFFCAPELIRSAEAAELAELTAERARSSYQVSARVIRRLSDRDRVDGLASVIELPRWQPDRFRLGAAPLIVVSDGLQSPGNIGAVLRTMDACRADLLIMTNLRARSTSAKVFQGSRGRSLTVPQLIFTDAGEVIDWLCRRSVTIMVADANGGIPYPRVDLRGPNAIVFGNERYGASPVWQGCDRIRIPMLGRADSLNVAVSAGVLLYHARAQRDRW
jgi:TrmH family RNA methyltransferase